MCWGIVGSQQPTQKQKQRTRINSVDMYVRHSRIGTRSYQQERFGHVDNSFPVEIAPEPYSHGLNTCASAAQTTHTMCYSFLIPHCSG